MKKILAILISAVMISCTVTMTSCSDNNQKQSSSGDVTVAATEAETTASDEKIKDLKYADYKTYNLDTSAEIKNIIIMIGDGMGENHIKAAEIQKEDKLNMEAMKYQGHVTTTSLSGVTDSAAAATAISCGVKTNNKSIAVDENGNDVENMFEFAKKNGMKTGIAMTEFIPHATPAAFSSHQKSRDAFLDIFEQQINNQVNVMLGAGQRFYNGKFDNLMKANNYAYITDPNDLKGYSSDKNLLGMFKYEIILAGYQPSLADMTSKALELLTNDNGFCLLVEGSDIDTRAAKKDMNSMLREMTIFDNAVDVVLQYAEKNPGTLVIVTADHETGGLEFPDGTTADELSDNMFTSGGEHTDAPVRIFVDGAQADKFLTSETIDNTDIAKQVRALYNSYGISKSASTEPTIIECY